MKSVYTGGEKVAEFESYDELRVGDGQLAFIYEGSELVYPNPVKNGLVLWYDFSGRTNTDGQRGIAEDLSGNGNHGTLQNFNYSAESGYDKNKLSFDGVDDYVGLPNGIISGARGWTFELTTVFNKWEGTSWINLFGASTTHSLLVHPTGGFAWYVNYEGTAYLIYSDITKNNIPLNTPVFFTCICEYTSEGKAKVTFKMNELESSSISDLNPSYDGFKPNTLGATGSNRMMKWSPSSAKFYNRPLTPEEIAHNYAIEKERFIDRVYPIPLSLPIGQGEISETLKVGGDK